jgi:hypothetical protein
MKWLLSILRNWLVVVSTVVSIFWCKPTNEHVICRDNNPDLVTATLGKNGKTG